MAISAAAKTAQTGKRIEVSIKKAVGPGDDKVHTWPHLVRAEFLCAILVTVAMIVWAIVVDAPLEDPANPTKTPNPSKAPWYFLGLQEILVYFDPWFAGVVLPSFIIVGLMVIPYIDINPKGNGYYCFKDRKFAISVFLFGFLVMWISLVIIGTFIRGPGWYLFLPGQYWDVHKTVAITNVNLADKLGIHDPMMGTLFGAGCLFVWLIVLPMAFWKARYKKSEVLQKLGMVRYQITAQLFMIMMGTVLKVFMRLGFNVKYIMEWKGMINV